VAVAAFILVVVIMLATALLNAPIKFTQQTTATLDAYLAEVRKSAIPFLIAMGVLGGLVGLALARALRRAWPNAKRRGEILAGYAFVTPYLLITLIFSLGVILFAFYISFTEYGIFTEPEFTGPANYVRAFQQKTFLQALHNVLWYALIVVPIQTVAALLLAVLLNAPMRLKQFFRTIFYAPSVTSAVVITLIFIWLYLKTGYINWFFAQIFGLFGAEWTAVDWFGDPRGLIQLIAERFGGEISSDQWYLRGPSIAWMSIMFQNIFTTAPTFMLMFLAGLQNINPEVYEAAEIDGANGLQKLLRVTVPLLRPIVVLVIVLGTIGTLQVFEQVYLATRGGPLGTTNTPVFEVYSRALGTLGPIEMGYGSALAFILAVIIFAFTFVQRRLLERGTEQY
jgi:multiple sugar transport system permease protein